MPTELILGRAAVFALPFFGMVDQHHGRMTGFSDLADIAHHLGDQRAIFVNLTQRLPEVVNHQDTHLSQVLQTSNQR